MVGGLKRAPLPILCSGEITAAAAAWGLHYRASRVDTGNWLSGHCCRHPEVMGEGLGLQWGWWEVLIAEFKVLQHANVCGKSTQQSYLPPASMSLLAGS